METFPAWENVTPVPLKEFERPIAKIAYSNEYMTAMNYFRAVMATAELSDRVLDLTKDIISMNSAHYTAWQYRRRCLFHLKKDLYEELDYIKDVALDCPKNYQIWYHRRVVIEELGDGSLEIPFINEALSLDAKNYHAWAHRQWVVANFGLWEGELSTIEKFLESDLRNNSAWNHRWFIVHNQNKGNEKNEPLILTKEIVHREVSFAWEYIQKALHNESPWNYLRAYLAEDDYQNFPEVKNWCESLLANDKNADDCVPLRNLLAEIYERDTTEEDCIAAAIEQLQKLQNDIDPIRVKYWERRIHRLTQKLR